MQRERVAVEFWDDLAMQILPEPMRTEAVAVAWAEWEQHRRERKQKVTPLSAKKSLLKIAQLGVDKAVRAIEHSIANGYQGIFEPNGREPAKPSDDQYQRAIDEGNKLYHEEQRKKAAGAA